MVDNEYQKVIYRKKITAILMIAVISYYSLIVRPANLASSLMDSFETFFPR